MKTPRYTRIKRKRRSGKEARRFLIYMAVCLTIVLLAHARFPYRAPETAEPGTITESGSSQQEASKDVAEQSDLDYEAIPEYAGKPYCEINGNVPTFTEKDKELLSSPGYEYYSALDLTGRCGYCEACVGPETMPEGEERGEIWTVHPSGWQSDQGWER